MIIDTARLGTARPAPGGGVVVPARIGRSGVQVYRRPDGSVVRAYRPAEDVRVADYAGAPITVGHPDGGMSPTRWRESVGFVRSQAAQTERIGAHEFVRADLQIADADAIARLGSELLECSCAYTADKDWTPGVTTDGETYDVVFRGLRPNHVALGPAGFARAGREARLIADGEDEMKDCLADNTLIADDGVAPLPGPALKPDGDHDKLVADHALAVAENARLSKELEIVKGSLAAAEARRDEYKTQVDGLPKAIADGVTEELAFRKAVADKLPVAYVFDGKSRREIRLDVIKAVAPKAVVEDSASDEFLDAFIAGIQAAPAAQHDHNTSHKVEDGTKQESVYAQRSREAFAIKGSK